MLAYEPVLVQSSNFKSTSSSIPLNLGHVIFKGVPPSKCVIR